MDMGPSLSSMRAPCSATLSVSDFRLHDVSDKKICQTTRNFEKDFFFSKMKCPKEDQNGKFIYSHI
jgi:hypothetical protein